MTAAVQLAAGVFHENGSTACRTPAMSRKSSVEVACERVERADRFRWHHSAAFYAHFAAIQARSCLTSFLPALAEQ